jgi:hypothetical protein
MTASALWRCLHPNSTGADMHAISFCHAGSVTAPSSRIIAARSP